MREKNTFAAPCFSFLVFDSLQCVAVASDNPDTCQQQLRRVLLRATTTRPAKTAHRRRAAQSTPHDGQAIPPVKSPSTIQTRTAARSPGKTGGWARRKCDNTSPTFPDACNLPLESSMYYRQKSEHPLSCLLCCIILEFTT